MSIQYKEALQNRLIGRDTINLLPSKCSCGAKINFSDSMTYLECTNEKCSQQVINKIIKFCKNLNINIDDNTIEKIVNRLGLEITYQFMMIDDLYKSNSTMLIDIQNIEQICKQIESIKTYEFELWQVVKLACIDKIGNIARKLFHGFQSIEEAYNEIESGQIMFIGERLGITNQDSMVLALDIYKTLLNIKEQLLFAETQFKIKRIKKPIIRIAFCTIENEIHPFINKSELIEKFEYDYNYIFLHTVTISDNTDILIRGVDDNNNKIRIARIINDRNIAELVNKGELSLNNAGKAEFNQFKPVGNKIYIDTLFNIQNRLEYMKKNGYIIK